jgi:hypothetical protein
MNPAGVAARWVLFQILAVALLLTVTAGCPQWNGTHPCAAGDGSERVLVRAVNPNVEGRAFAWRGRPDVEIELLDPDCTAVGVIEPYRFNAQGNVPGIAAVSDCGGFVVQSSLSGREP